MYVPLFFTPSWDQSPEAWICTLDLQTLRIALMEIERLSRAKLLKRGSAACTCRLNSLASSAKPLKLEAAK